MNDTRRDRRPAIPAAFALCVSVLVAVACGAPHTEEDAATASEDALTLRDQPLVAQNLRDGEIVLTFDDGPSAHSGAVAELLQQRGHVGLFFVVSKHLGDGGPTLDATGLTRLGDVVRRGQLVANHTHDHCIGGASACGGRAFASLPAAEQRRQVELTDGLLTRALDRLDAEGAYLPFLRPPGNSWSASTARSLTTARVSPRTYGPVAWNVPAPGEEDFRCWSQGTSAEACAARYVSAFRALPRGQQRAVVLVHDNFAQAAELTRRVLDGLVGTRTKAGAAVRVVHPRCVVGCTR